MTNTRRTFDLPEHLARALQAMAKDMGQTEDALLNQAIFHLAKLHGYITPAELALESKGEASPAGDSGAKARPATDPSKAERPQAAADEISSGPTAAEDDFVAGEDGEAGDFEDASPSATEDRGNELGTGLAEQTENDDLDEDFDDDQANESDLAYGDDEFDDSLPGTHGLDDGLGDDFAGADADKDDAGLEADMPLAAREGLAAGDGLSGGPAEDSAGPDSDHLAAATDEPEPLGNPGENQEAANDPWKEDADSLIDDVDDDWGAADSQADKPAGTLAMLESAAGAEGESSGSDAADLLGGLLNENGAAGDDEDAIGDSTIITGPPPMTSEFGLSLRTEQATVHVGEAEFRIGRGNECDLVIRAQLVSRVHATVVRRGNLFVLNDSGSRNGTWLNGERITEHEIKHGDVFEIGGQRVEALVTA